MPEDATASVSACSIVYCMLGSRNPASCMVTLFCLELWSRYYVPGRFAPTPDTDSPGAARTTSRGLFGHARSPRIQEAWRVRR